MRTQTLFDFSVILSEHADAIVHGTARLDESKLQKFWIESRVRFDCWGLKLRRCAHQLEASDFLADSLWGTWQPILEEILVSESVTRVWAATLHAIDHQLGIQEYSPIGRSAVLAHKEARRRVLRLLLRGQHANNATAIQLNRLRGSVERWVDLLVADIYGPQLDLSRYGFDEKRLRGLQEISRGPNRKRAGVIRAAAAQVFPQSALVCSEHVRHHEQIHGNILGSLGKELFLPTSGQMVSGWQARIYRLTDDTQGLINSLMNEVESTAASVTVPRRWN